MTEIVREHRTSSGVGWLALALSAVALLLAIMAYNRSGRDIDDAVRDALNSASQSTQEAARDAGNAGSNAVDSSEGALDRGPDGQDDGAQ